MAKFTEETLNNWRYPASNTEETENCKIKNSQTQKNSQKSCIFAAILKTPVILNQSE